MAVRAVRGATQLENDVREHMLDRVAEMVLDVMESNGLTVDEIKEVLLHTAVYAGVPAANSAFAIAQQVLVEEGEE